jgi:SHS2 domain-containing protein
MQDFETFEHTADVGIRACGATMAEAFANAARGLFSLITDLDIIEERRSREVSVTASDRELLLVEWLNQLVYLFDVEYLLFKRFQILHLTDTGLTARCFGEKVDKSRHQLKTGIKSATYHMLKVEEDQGFRVQVLFDV